MEEEIQKLERLPIKPVFVVSSQKHKTLRAWRVDAVALGEVHQGGLVEKWGGNKVPLPLFLSSAGKLHTAPPHSLRRLSSLVVSAGSDCAT